MQNEFSQPGNLPHNPNDFSMSTYSTNESSMSRVRQCEQPNTTDPGRAGASASEFSTESFAPRERPPAAGMSVSMLSRYFRDIATHQVIGADEEIEYAQAVEKADIEHWVALLSYMPVAEPILEQLDQDIAKSTQVDRPDMAQVGKLRNIIRAYRMQRSKLSAEQQRQWNELSIELSRYVRLLDVDRTWKDCVLIKVKGIVDANSCASGRPAIAKTPAFRRYIDRIHQTACRQSEAKNNFAKANLRLVVKLARRYDRGRLPLIDLIQEGNIGLMKAVERFDHTRGFRFSTYATWWILHAIRRALADKGRAIRIPVHMLETYNCASRATQMIIASTGCEPTSDELEKATGIPQEKLEKLRDLYTGTPLSLDRTAGKEDGSRFVDFLTAEDSVSPIDGLAHQEWAKEVKRLLGTLTPIESRIVRWRFGLDNDPELTLKEIGDKYGLSRERIRQLQDRAICKMRRQVRDLWL